MATEAAPRLRGVELRAESVVDGVEDGVEDRGAFAIMGPVSDSSRGWIRTGSREFAHLQKSCRAPNLATAQRELRAPNGCSVGRFARAIRESTSHVQSPMADSRSTSAATPAILTAAAVPSAPSAHTPASLPDRLRWLRAFRDAVKSHHETLCALASDEVGKTTFEALAADILPLIASCNWHLRHARGLLATTRVRGGGLFGLGHAVERRRLPVGRVLVIATWNYPVQLLGVQLVQAIVAGNSVVVKPSERAPRTQALLLNLAIAATDGIPSMRGAIETRAASREEGARLLRDERFDHVVFTGSTAVGRAIAEVCASKLLPTTLELSGSDTAFILGDADARAAARAVFLGFTGNAGQTCMAPRRALVERPALAAFTDELARLVAGAKRVRLVDAHAANATRTAAASAMTLGGRSIVGALEPTDGRAMRPIAVLDCPVETELFFGRHFGPALAVRAVDSLEEALALHAQIGQYLATSVWTRAPRARRAEIERAIASCGSSLVHFNSVLLPSAHPGIALGGHGASGWGISRGASGLLGLTREVTVTRTSRFLAPPVEEPAPSAVAWLSRIVAWPTRPSRAASAIDATAAIDPTDRINTESRATASHEPPSNEPTRPRSEANSHATAQVTPTSSHRPEIHA